MAISGGLAGVIANDSARYSLFWSCMDKLQLPPGWQKEHLLGGDWCGARNSLVEITLKEDFEWLWFMDDDHAFAPNILTKLLSHNKKIIMPVCLTRTSPFAPVTFTERIDEKRYLPIYLPEQPQTGLVELVAGGCAGMLIHRDVLEAIEPPWFEYGTASEDILFCNKAKEAGFEIFCDLATRLGHITTAVVWPANDTDGDWVVGFNIGRDLNLIAPIAPREYPTLEEGAPDERYARNNR